MRICLGHETCSGRMVSNAKLFCNMFVLPSNVARVKNSISLVLNLETEIRPQTAADLGKMGVSSLLGRWMIECDFN